MQEIMELFCAGDVNRPTMFLALASVAAACNRYPEATTSFNKLAECVHSRLRVDLDRQNAFIPVSVARGAAIWRMDSY